MQLVELGIGPILFKLPGSLIEKGETICFLNRHY